MAIEAAFDVPGKRFPLACVLEELPDATVELDRVVPTNGETIPYFWLRDPDVESFDPDAVSHPDLRAIDVVDTVGEGALAVLERRGDEGSIPDLVLLDLNLPDTSGETVLERIRSSTTLRRLPVIVLSSSNADEDVESCYRAAANASLTKPIAPDDLVSMIESLETFWFEHVRLPSQ
ncbi:response regulator [Natronococcus sp.]|uniref:response regulator n=1 Tax=Natronococcus sp. TaxID=35747 RepID=UPI003A4DAF28